MEGEELDQALRAAAQHLEMLEGLSTLVGAATAMRTLLIDGGWSEQMAEVVAANYAQRMMMQI